MRMVGSIKLCGAGGVSKARSNPLPPPNVNFSLQSNCINDEGDFQDGNRLLCVCPIFTNLSKRQFAYVITGLSRNYL